VHLGAGIGEKGGAVVGGWCVRFPADYPGTATLNPPRNIPKPGQSPTKQARVPKWLESLFRLDHLAAHMRRNGENLLIPTTSKLPGSVSSGGSRIDSSRRSALRDLVDDLPDDGLLDVAAPHQVLGDRRVCSFQGNPRSAVACGYPLSTLPAPQ
jgi:hypothetical protein